MAADALSGPSCPAPWICTPAYLTCRTGRGAKCSAVRVWFRRSASWARRISSASCACTWPRHGIGRPLWLCDAGRLPGVPARGVRLGLLSRGRPSLSGWVGCVIGLARGLLGAVPSPSTHVNGPVPAWVMRAVLWCWGAEPGRSLWRHLLDPIEAVRRLNYHGISPGHGSAPIKDAYRLGLGPLARTMRLPSLLVQLAAFAPRQGAVPVAAVPLSERDLRCRLGPHLSIHR